MNYDSNMTAQEYMELLSFSIPEIEDPTERMEMVNHLMRITTQVDYLESCYHKEAYESA
jgi:hypothetical protein